MEEYDSGLLAGDQHGVQRERQRVVDLIRRQQARTSVPEARRLLDELEEAVLDPFVELN